MTWGDLDWNYSSNPRRRAANREANQERQAIAKENARIAREARRAANRRAFASGKRRATLSSKSSK